MLLFLQLFLPIIFIWGKKKKKIEESDTGHRLLKGPWRDVRGSPVSTVPSSDNGCVWDSHISSPKRKVSWEINHAKDTFTFHSQESRSQAVTKSWRDQPKLWWMSPPASPGARTTQPVCYQNRQIPCPVTSPLKYRPREESDKGRTSYRQRRTSQTSTYNLRKRESAWVLTHMKNTK